MDLVQGRGACTDEELKLVRDTERIRNEGSRELFGKCPNCFEKTY